MIALDEVWSSVGPFTPHLSRDLVNGVVRVVLIHFIVLLYLVRF